MPTVPSLLLDPLGFFDDDSFSLIRRMQREMNRVFSQAGLDRGDGASTTWMPATEIAYRNGNLVVSAELPGLSENDVKVEVNDGFLVIRGERKIEREDNQRGVQRTERQYGEFYRAIALPDGADGEHARAEFQNGVLHVTIPVPEAKRNSREIPVQASAGSSESAASSQTAQQKQTGTETRGEQKAA
jgi:HSP20 family protein